MIGNTKAPALLITALVACSIAIALGQTPTPTVPADATEIYAKAHDGVTCLQWNVYLPDGVSETNPAPVVLVVHIGGFRGGARDDDGPKRVATSLRNAGFIACSIDYRLDFADSFLGVPDKQICKSGCQNQTTAAFADNLMPAAPETQFSDVRKAIVAARNPTCGILVGKVNGLVGVVAGSAGGTHALTCAAGWTNNDNRPDAVVCLSGIYQFDEPHFPDGNPHNLPDAMMYCRATSGTDPNLGNGSNLKLVEKDCAPVYAFGSEEDSITPQQLELLKGKFIGLNLDPLDHRTQKIEGSKHAFAYWYDKISASDQRYVYLVVQDWLHERLDDD